MGFNKFDPTRTEDEAAKTQSERRAKLLRWWTLITMLYTAIGFAFVVLFLLYGNPFQYL